MLQHSTQMPSECSHFLQIERNTSMMTKSFQISAHPVRLCGSPQRLLTMTPLELAHQAHMELFCDRDLHLALQRTEGTKTSMGDGVDLVHERWSQQHVSTPAVLCTPALLFSTFKNGGPTTCPHLGCATFPNTSVSKSFSFPLAPSFKSMSDSISFPVRFSHETTWVHSFSTELPMKDHEHLT